MNINLISKAVCTSTAELLGIHKPNSCKLLLRVLGMETFLLLAMQVKSDK